jgi:hypothetical protein
MADIIANPDKQAVLIRYGFGIQENILGLQRNILPARVCVAHNRQHRLPAYWANLNCIGVEVYPARSHPEDVDTSLVPCLPYGIDFFGVLA